jgi:hypothetical protein
MSFQRPVICQQKFKKVTFEGKLCQPSETGCPSPVKVKTAAGSCSKNKESEFFYFITKTNCHSFTGQSCFD